ncbi:MAG: methylmalonyl-CoA mutase family protein, partial [Chloroflexota bacterium]
QQPEVNLIRTAIEALAGVLGGTQSLHTNSMDEALWLPTQKAVRVALRTQQIIANEAGVADSIDPLAGSYVVEALTDEIERRACEYIDRIDEMGGALAAIEKGYIQGEIQDAAYAFQQAMERGEEVVVGVNAFQVDEKIDLERLAVDPAIEQSQRRRLAALRARRDSARAAELMARLDTAARGSENLLPLFIECVEHDLTLGEVCNVLRGVWGEYQSPAWI